MNGNINSQDVLHGAHVLIVEDDFLLSLELQSTLEDAGAEVGSVCRSIEEAISTASDTSIAVAVLDYRLGTQTITPVARMLAERGTPIVFYTGQTEQRRGLLDLCPYSRFIAKPASAQSVVAAVAELLQSGVIAEDKGIARA